MIFETHGSINLKWQNDVLSIHTQGPFNLEGIHHAFQQIKNEALRKNAQVWTRIDIIDENTFGAPDVMKIIGETYKFCFVNGCQGIAIVNTSILQQRMVDRFQKSQRVNLKSFQDLNSAHAWCNELLLESDTHFA